MENTVMKQFDKITLGVCYYPEQWEERLWPEDLKKMSSYGIKVVRIAEFAWNKIEPEDGRFTFAFFDRFLDLALEYGIKVIFCTPTATPPAWLTFKYPEILNVTKEGVVYHHGLRKHYTYNSPIYQQYVKRIVTQIAAHYAAHPAIIGWQIDNELNCETNVFYSKSDHIQFRQYLKERFVTLDAFNEAMGTVFWNQMYTNWDEVQLSGVTPGGTSNPHLLLEEKRFFSKSTIAFCAIQAACIRPYCRPDQFITTNGIFGHVDNHEMVEQNLDFITYDSYPNFAFETAIKKENLGRLRDRKNSLTLSHVRAISAPFGIMEQQSGAGGWDAKMKQPAPKPGQMRLWTFQSIAHGADFISYFRFRTSWIGTEIYWHGLLDYSNEPNRRVRELLQISKEIDGINEIAGTRYQASIALLKDYDNEWDGEQDQWHGPLSEFSEMGWFTAAQLSHTPMDLIYLRKGNEDLSKYKLIIYPHATILTEERAKQLEDYVKDGGTLIMGCRTGYKDIYGRCPMRPMPGYASSLCGVKVVDYTNLGPDDREEYIIWENERMEAPMFNDILETVEEGTVIGSFEGNYYDTQPGLVECKKGAGKAYYYGAGFSEQTAKVFLTKLGLANPYHELFELPEKVELAVRYSAEMEYYFLLNYWSSEVNIVIKEPCYDQLSHRELYGEETMGAYGVLILESIDKKQ